MTLENLGEELEIPTSDPDGQGADDQNQDILDPGQQEGVKREHEPPPAHPRFKQIYAEAKTNKAKVDELTQKVTETESVFGELRAQNEQLTKTLQEIQAGQQKKTTDDQLTAVQTTLADLKTQRAEALDANDLKKAYEIQDQIQELTIKMHTPAPKKEELADIDAALTKRETEKAVAAFASETAWFNTKNPDYDPIMVGAAKELDAVISKDPVWGKKPVAEQLAEVKKRVETRFGYKGAQGNPPEKGRLPGVGEINTGGGASRGSVTLTAEQVKVARMLFPNETNPETKYAEQLRLSRR